MKKIYTIAITTLLLFVGCKDDSTTIEGFEANTTEIEAKASGGEYSVVIRSDREWTAQADVPWLMVSPANGRGEVTCKIKIDSTLLNDARDTKIRFFADGMVMQEVVVNQAGFGRNITPNTNDISIAASAMRSERWVEVDITSNVEFVVENNAEWLSINDYTLTLDRGARPRTTRLRLDWKMNSDPEVREAVLSLKAKDGGELDTPATITIRQQAGPLIEDNRAGDSLAVITIHDKMACWSSSSISTSESMNRWESVRLWEANDPSLPCAEAVGRVRDLDLSYFDTEDGIPTEIKHLKYLETLSFMGNVNTMLKNIELCEEIATLNYLKDLRIAAMGLVSLPANFAELGDTLESLDLSSNNFTSIPEVINADNFPMLKILDLSSNRRAVVSDLSTANRAEIGMYSNMEKSDAMKRLFLWESLEELSLSYNYLEGALPDFRAGEDGVRGYTHEDVAMRGDTLNYAVENNLARILPNMRALRINLNFMTGDIPDWLLYHPNLMEWSPEILIYTQMEKSYDSEGNMVSFDNVPLSREYYFEAYPLYRSRYEFNDEME